MLSSKCRHREGLSTIYLFCVISMLWLEKGKGKGTGNCKENKKKPVCMGDKTRRYRLGPSYRL
jgi:hypothetical protein